jgi:Periplasmic protease
MPGKMINSLKAFVCLHLLMPLASAGIPQSPTTSGLYAEPGISPDGSTIAFVSGGDIWQVPATGGTAHLLVAHQADESRPIYSPDGKYLAFQSDRTGKGDIYVLSLSDGRLTRLTYDDAVEEPSGWSPDSRMIYFHTSGKDISSMNDVYRVSREGGTPMVVTGDRYANEFFAVPSPDQSAIAFAARGISSRQWWRKGSSHLDHAEIWLYHIKDGANQASDYEPFTGPGARDIWPMWSKDGKSIYYVSDRNGQENIWMKSIGGQPQALTDFKDGRVLWPTIDKNSTTIVFERDFEIWKYDIAARKPVKLSISLSGVNTSHAITHLKESSGFSDMTISGDGKKVAFIFHSHVFAASAQDGGHAIQVSGNNGIESSIVWNPTGNKLVYSSWREGKCSLYQYDFMTSKESRLTTGGDDTGPVYSGNGQWLAYLRNGKELRVINTKTGNDRLLYRGYFGNMAMFRSNIMAWSPDNKWLAFIAHGDKSLRNVWVVPVTGGKATQVSFLANSNSGNLCWSPDGQSIYFTTNQRTEMVRVARVDLVPPVRNDFTEDRFYSLFKENKGDTARRKTDAPLKDSVRIVAAGIRERMSLLPLDISVGSMTISPDGKQLLISTSVAGQQHLFTFATSQANRRGGAALKQLTTTGGMKTDAVFDAAGKTIYYLEQGRLYRMPLESRTPHPVSITAELDVDFETEKMMVAEQAWKTLQIGFYDSAFHGVDWDGVYTRFKPFVSKVKTPAELYRTINLMIGELNASHTGISAGGSGGMGESTTAHLGLLFDRSTYEKSGRLKISEVVELGPADITGKIKTGDYLLAINGSPVNSKTNIDQLLENQLDRKITLTIGNDKGATTQVAVSPVNMAAEKRLLYRQWVHAQREYVDKISHGKLGYVHMYDMGQPSLDQLYIDLDAENINRQGVVVDVRNNNGGFVNAYAIDVFARKPYMTMTTRGLPSAPARTQLGQRSLGAATILLTNQHSLSDAEDFTEGYRTLGLGKVVGEPTGGWIIYTSSARMIDGSSMRLPFSRITDHAGKTMELVPRPVDIEVRRPIGESYSGKSVQLDIAVKELLNQLNGTKMMTSNQP